MAGTNKEARLNLLITAKDEAQTVINEFVRNLEASMTKIKENGASMNMASVFEAIGTALGDMSGKMDVTATTATKDATEVTTAFTKIAESSFRTRQLLETDFDKVKAGFNNESLAAVKASDMTTTGLAKIVSAAEGDSTKIVGYVDKIATSIEKIGGTTYKTKEEIAKDFDAIKVAFDNESLAAAKMEQLTKSDIEKMASAFYEADIKIVNSLKHIADAEENTKNKTPFDFNGFAMNAQMAGQTMQSAGNSINGFFKDAITNAAEFDQNITNTVASMNFKLPAAAKLSADEIRKMTDEAIKLGNEGYFNATHVAEGMSVLANQGMSYELMMGGAAQTVHDVAAANQQDLAETANVVTDIANEMGEQLASKAKTTAEGQRILNSEMSETQKHAALVASQLPGVGDAMTAALHSGRMSMTDFLNTMKYVGPQAGALHMDFNELAASIALLTQHGIKGSQAGTGLRRELTNLLPQSKEAQAAMDALGITTGDMVNKFFTADGSIKSMSQIQETLHESTNRLGDAQQQAAIKAIFGQYALSAMTVTAHESPAAFKELVAQMSQTGTTHELLAEKSKGLGIQLSAAQNQFDTIKKVIGDDFKPVLIELLQHVHSLMDAWNHLSPSTRKIIEYIALGVGAFLAIGGTILVLIGTIGFFVTALEGIGTAIVAVAAAAPEVVTVVAIVAGVIAAVVALAVSVFTIVTNWGTVSAFFTKLWGDIQTTFNAATVAIGQTLTGWWTDIKAVFSTAMSTVGTTASNAWTAVKTTTSTVWGETSTWLTTNIKVTMSAVVAGFEWMYQHNYYFKQLADFIRKVWETIQKDATEIWTAISTFFDKLWTGIKTAAEKMWNDEMAWLNLLWTAIVKLADTVWTPITTFFSGVWDSVSTGMVTTWNEIKTTMSGLWTGIITDAKAIFNGLGTFFTELGNQAFTWGSNLVHMIADGIKSAASYVADAAKSVAKSITNFLGFHSPTKEGPAADADTWMPNMMTMFTSGIHQHLPTIQNAIGAVAVGIQTSMAPANIVNNATNSVNVPAGGGRSPAPVTVIVQVEGRSAKTDEAIAEMIANKFRTYMSWAT